MALSYDQVGAIVAGCAGGGLLLIFLIMYFCRGLVCYTFPHRPNHRPTTRSLYEDYDLEAQRAPSTIRLAPLNSPAIPIIDPISDSTRAPTSTRVINPPAHRAPVLGIGVINRELSVTERRHSAESNMTPVPTLPVLQLPRPDSASPEEQVQAVMSRVSSAVDAETEMDITDCGITVPEGEGVQEEVFVIGGHEDEVAEEISVAASAPVVERKLPEWGTGKGMSQLYVIKEEV